MLGKIDADASAIKTGIPVVITDMSARNEVTRLFFWMRVVDDVGPCLGEPFPEGGIVGWSAQNVKMNGAP